MSCIKSIQRGTGDTSTTSFTINEVNPEKCVVIIDPIVTTSASLYNVYTCGMASISPAFYWGNTNGGATLSSITATTLTFSNVKNTFGWQLIEFT